MASRVSSEAVKTAAQALLKWRESQSATEKPQLLEQDEFFYLIVTLKKIPANSRTNPFKIPLPHALIDPQTSEICMIIDDRPKSKLTKDAAQKKIKAENIPVSKVIKLSKLRTDYKAFEAKRKLCDSFDLFLADKRVLPLLPKLLGKQFFKKRKIPIGVDLEHKGWKEQVENICNSALLFMGSGTCSVVKVAKASMGKKEIAENVVAAIDGIAEVVPRKWGNIRSFLLKMLESLSMPVYQSVPGFKLKIEGVSDKREVLGGEEVKEEDVDEIVVEKKKKKKTPLSSRIHDIRYMGTNLDDEDDSDIEDNDTGSAEIGIKKTKKEDGEEEKTIELSRMSKKSENEHGMNKHKKGAGELLGKKEKKNITKVEKLKRNKK